MTMTEIEAWELTIPDEVEPCWVFPPYPWICVDAIAEWMVAVKDSPKEYPLCTGCKDRWVSYSTVHSVRPIR